MIPRSLRRCMSGKTYGPDSPRTGHVFTSNSVTKSTRILVGCALLCASVWAQSDRGTLTGTVSDPSGAAVVAREASSGAEHPAATTDTGNFTITSLPAGSYDLMVAASGFRGYLQKG